MTLQASSESWNDIQTSRVPFYTCRDTPPLPLITSWLNWPRISVNIASKIVPIRTYNPYLYLLQLLQVGFLLLCRLFILFFNLYLHFMPLSLIVFVKSSVVQTSPTALAPTSEGEWLLFSDTFVRFSIQISLNSDRFWSNLIQSSLFVINNPDTILFSSENWVFSVFSYC